jgi:flagellar biosynthesis protein FlhG
MTGRSELPDLNTNMPAGPIDRDIRAARAIAGQLNIPFIDPIQAAVEPSAVTLLPPETAFKRQALPIRMVNDRLMVAMESPDQPVAIRSLELLTGVQILPAAAPKGSLEAALQKYYGNRDGQIHITDLKPATASKTVAPGGATSRNIAIISNKGGVGKTHPPINLAYAIAGTGKRVLLIDADLGNADISNKLGVFPKSHLMDFLEKKKLLRDLISPTDFGFDLIGGSYGEFRLANLYHAQKMKFIRHFKTITGDYDFVVFDLGAGISRTVLDFALAADHTLIVTTPQDVISGYACVKAAFTRFKEIETRLEEKSTGYTPQFTFSPMVVVNQINDTRQGTGIFNNIKKTADENINSREARFNIRIEYMGAIPYDKENMRLTEGKRKPVLMTSPHIKVSQSIQHMSGRFCNMKDEYDPNVKFMNPFKRFTAILSQNM